MQAYLLFLLLVAVVGYCGDKFKTSLAFHLYQEDKADVKRKKHSGDMSCPCKNNQERCPKSQTKIYFNFPYERFTVQPAEGKLQCRRISSFDLDLLEDSTVIIYTAYKRSDYCCQSGFLFYCSNKHQNHVFPVMILDMP